MAYTLVIGTQNWSSWSLRPYVAIAATGAPFETVVIKLREKQHPTTREMILPHSPAGKVPVLKIAEDGKTTTVWDSLAICETLADRHPGSGLLPTDPTTRAICRAYACEMHSGFPDVRDQLVGDVMEASMIEVEMETPLERLTHYINKDNGAVLVRDESGQYNILTKYDILNAFSKG